MNNFIGILSRRKAGGLFNQLILDISRKYKFNTYWNTDVKIENLDDKVLFLCDMLEKSPTHGFIRYRRAKKLDYYHIDHGYFWRGYAHVTGNKNPHNCTWFRIAKNCHVLNEILDVDDYRWKKYFYDYFGGYGKEYSRKGSKILFCPPSPSMISLYHQEKWVEETLEVLKKNTDREIVIRAKPQIKFNDMISPTTNKTLEEDLEDCWALVTHSSCAAITAQLMGIPTFSDFNSPSTPVSLSDYSRIENPYYPEDEIRMKWLNSLAYSQYSTNEIENIKI